MPSFPVLPIRALLVISTFCPVLAAAEKLAEVDVVVDFTAAGRKLAHPTPGNPAYYYPVMSDFEEFGTLVAGERAPRLWDAAHVVALELAKQGYLEMHPGPFTNKAGQVTYADGTVVTVPANPTLGHPLELNVPGDVPLTVAMLDSRDGPYSLTAARSGTSSTDRVSSRAVEALRTSDPIHGPVLTRLPTLIISIQLGYVNPKIDTSPAPPAGTSTSFSNGSGNNYGFVSPGGSAASASSGVPVANFDNWNQMVGLVAGNTFKDPQVATESALGEIPQKVLQDRYFFMINAYDFESYRRTQRLVLLWQAKMSTPSDSLAQYSDALDALVRAGGPYFGRETTEPKSILLPVTPDGHVNIGEPVVITSQDTAH